MNTIEILVVSIFVIIPFVYIYNDISKTKENYEQENQQINIEDIKTDEKLLNAVRNMLRDIDTLLNNNQITYWIDGGTLLGAVRHKDIIPWDDDGDLVILVEDEDNFLTLQPKLNQLGYGLSKTWCGYKIFPLNGTDIKYWNRNWKWDDADKDIQVDERFDYKFPFIDVMLIDKYNDKIYHFFNEKVRRVWPNYYHETKDIFPLKRYKFSDFELTGPNDPIPYLDRSYGNDWPDTAYKEYDHENQKILNKEKFKIN